MRGRAGRRGRAHEGRGGVSQSSGVPTRAHICACAGARFPRGVGRERLCWRRAGGTPDLNSALNTPSDKAAGVCGRANDRVNRLFISLINCKPSV